MSGPTVAASIALVRVFADWHPWSRSGPASSIVHFSLDSSRLIFGHLQEAGGCLGIRLAKEFRALQIPRDQHRKLQARENDGDPR
jgi:hypothetical protein